MYLPYVTLIVMQIYSINTQNVNSKVKIFQILLLAEVCIFAVYLTP